MVENDPGSCEELASTVFQLGRAYVELHQPARARDLLDRFARALDDPAPDICAAIEFTRARALRDTGADRARAHELATRALADIRKVVTARR